jgi:hypothetical protein
MKFLASIKPILLLLLTSALYFVLSAQSEDPFGGDPFGGDPFGGMIDSSAQVAPIPNKQSGNQSSTHSNTAASGSQGNAEYPFSQSITEPEVESNTNFQNAIIEGVQLTAEKSETTDEKVISCYFIFRDKPTSYFYEVKVRDKKLIFEFNDTRTGSSPVPTASEYPIKGFKIESGKVDINKDVKGLMPEWHDMIRVLFDLDQVPKVHVSDEYSIISFSFKWTSDPSKYKLYTVKDNSRKVVIISSATVGGVLIGGGIYALIKITTPPPGEKPLTSDDLPQRHLPSSVNFGF